MLDIDHLSYPLILFMVSFSKENFVLFMLSHLSLFFFMALGFMSCLFPLVLCY